jgi:hypothetical protein
MIYTPNERSLAETIVSKLPSAWEYRFAPAGLEAGTDAWKDIVKRDLDACDLAIAILSSNAFEDKSVIWRCQYAFDNEIQFLPVLWMANAPGFSLSDLMEKSYLIFISRYQAFQLGMRTEAPSQVDEQQLAQLSDVIDAVMGRRTVCFISYSRREADFAARLAVDLRANKVRTWRDAENIPAGINWDREIEKAVNECTHLLLIATPHSVASDNVMDEVGLALNKKKAVIPVMVETCDLPLRVHRAQWVDFRESYEQGLAALLEELGL